MEVELFLPHRHQIPIPISRSSSSSLRLFDRFTANEIAAAAQLVLLSESSGESEQLGRSASPLSASSVNAVENGDKKEEEEEEGVIEMEGPWRRKRRYRSMAVIYAATAPIGSRGNPKQRRKREREEEKE